MTHLKIKGGKKISGDILISGAKNSSMPILISSLLTKEPVVLHNVPYVTDIITLLSLQSSIGTQISLLGESPMPKTIRVITPEILNANDLISENSKIRTSVLLMGPSLARNGYFKLFTPGGCNIGERKIDFHIAGMQALGAQVTESSNYLELSTNGKRLEGTTFTFPSVSVGATQNMIIASALANGITILKNCAMEPEIGDLIKFLNKIGGNISFNAKREIIIEGVPELHGGEYIIMPDRIEALTYIMIAAITGGKMTLKNISMEALDGILPTLEKIGIKIESQPSNFFFNSIEVHSIDKISPISIETAPFPGLATDLQPLIMVLMLKANGISTITENIFENRFQHVPYLEKMGANVSYCGKTIEIKGNQSLKGAEVEGTDLRACAALAMAGLAATGETIIKSVEKLDRGYYNFVKNIINCGGMIERIY